jgi:hypothetical protein
MADFLVLMADKLDSTRTDQLRRLTKAREVTDIRSSDSLCWFNQFLVDMFLADIAAISIFMCEDVIYPAGFYLGPWQAELVIKVDPEWLSSMEQSCKTFSKLGEVISTYYELEDRLDEYQSQHAYSEGIPEELADKLKSLNFQDQVEIKQDKLFQNLKNDITQRRLSI